MSRRTTFRIISTFSFNQTTKSFEYSKPSQIKRYNLLLLPMPLHKPFRNNFNDKFTKSISISKGKSNLALEKITVIEVYYIYLSASLPPDRSNRVILLIQWLTIKRGALSERHRRRMELYSQSNISEPMEEYQTT